ncbi:hypothetical protein CLAIMM_07965 [Cladophialophora immunda]|nr:hypothetical protein CLAIMM_07965 [Cladophialophora immunda]
MDLEVKQPQHETCENVQIELVPEIDPAMARRITSRCDMYLLPWLFGIWFFCFLDRASIGNAKIEGLGKDLGLTGDQINIALSIFFVSYILVDIPSNWLVKRLKAGWYLPGLCIGFGVVTTCLGFVKSYAGLLVARFFLGMFEGGIIAGIVLYLSMFYPRSQMVSRIAAFYCASPFSGAFGGLLASGLSQIQYRGLNRWPWIFIIEGIMTTLFGIGAFIFLQDAPDTASFLSEEERRVAVQRMKFDNPIWESAEVGIENKFHWRWVKIGILDPNTLMASLGWFFIIVPIYSFAFFLPTIINALDYSNTVSQLLSVPPNLTGFFMVLFGATLADKFKRRGILLIIGCLLGVAGYVMLLASSNPRVQYGGTIFVAAGIFPCTPLILGWLSSQITPDYARATAGGAQVSIGNMAAFVATFSYVAKDAHGTEKATSSTSAP